MKKKKITLDLNKSELLLANHTPFNEHKVTERIPQLTLNSDIPISDQRDIITETNGGTVAKDGAEYRVRASTTSNSSAILETEQTGNYISGAVLEPAMGVRIPTQPTGDAYIRWGYYDDEAGIFLEYTSSGLTAKVRSGGIEADSIAQADFSDDALDGSKSNSNASGVSLDPSDGHMYQFPFIYYGYGSLEWWISILDENGIFRMNRVNLLKRTGSISLSRPNLPLKIEVNSGTSGVQLDAYVGGRQISAWGRTDKQGRNVGAYRTVSGVDTSFVPLITFREKTNFERIISRFRKINIISDADLIWEIHRDSTLAGTSFGTPGNYTATEIATEWDTSATSTYTSGETVAGGLAEGGTRGVFHSADLPNRIITNNNTYTLAVRRITGTNASVTGYVEAFEEW